MTPDIELLLDAAEDGSPDATRDLVAIVRQAIRRPDQRVSTALFPKGRGGEPGWIAEQRAERDAAYRDAAIADYGTVRLTPSQASILARKVKRALIEAHIAEGAGNVLLDAVRRIRASGSDPIGSRQLLRVLPK